MWSNERTSSRHISRAVVRRGRWRFAEVHSSRIWLSLIADYAPNVGGHLLLDRTTLRWHRWGGYHYHWFDDRAPATHDFDRTLQTAARGQRDLFLQQRLTSRPRSCRFGRKHPTLRAGARVHHRGRDRHRRRTVQPSSRRGRDLGHRDGAHVLPMGGAPIFAPARDRHWRNARGRHHRRDPIAANTATSRCQHCHNAARGGQNGARSRSQQFCARKDITSRPR